MENTSKKAATRGQHEVVAGDGIVTVRPRHDVFSKQGLQNFIGISAESAGSRALSLNMVVIPPGGRAEPHYHDGFETAIYLIRGRVRTLFGTHLEKSVLNVGGDFLLIPASVPHQPCNTSNTEPAYAIVARNDPREQESVVLYAIPERSSTEEPQ